MPLRMSTAEPSIVDSPKYVRTLVHLYSEVPRYLLIVEYVHSMCTIYMYYMYTEVCVHFTTVQAAIQKVTQLIP